MAELTLRLGGATSKKIDKIARLSGQNVRLCMQCATCSAVCPMAESMWVTPRHVMHLLQLGLTDAAVEARVGQLCAACHTCTVRCPRGIDVARVFEAVRLLVLRDNVDLVCIGDLSREVRRAAPQIALVSAFRKLTA
jgi:heterodisulfide reductase subunit C